MAVAVVDGGLHTGDCPCGARPLEPDVHPQVIRRGRHERSDANLGGEGGAAEAQGKVFGFCFSAAHGEQ